MSWFARSIANSLRPDDDDDDHSESNENVEREVVEQHNHIDSSSQPPPSTQGRGVKEDLSELSKTLTLQLWGVASFLAPPPADDSSPTPKPSDSSPREGSDSEVSDSAGISGIRSDFAEIGGKFRSGISKLSNNIAVSEITKIASNLLQLGSDEEEDYDSGGGGAVGVTEEVVGFVMDITMHPETWLNFPLPDDEDADNFDMSDAQQEHALAVEHRAPRLAALRIELCPGYISEGCFWKIYFVLLHPRLNKNVAELLSTPQIVKARALLTQDLQNQTKAKPEQDMSGMGTSYSKDASNSPHEESLSVTSSVQSEYMPLDTSAIQTATSQVAEDCETEKNPVLSNEIPIIDKSVVEEGPVSWTDDQVLHSSSSPRVFEKKNEDDTDDWLKEENSEIVGNGGTTITIENEEDVSFSDLEDDDGGDISTSYKKATYGFDASTKDSRDWVQLSTSSVDSSKDINVISIEREGSEQVCAHNHKSETKESIDWLNVDDIDVV
ncbi:uncharacterized protein LOC132286876 [Cornus florida]|uniref:uncharacterized protein LOC132286876 n=1 Tax=Cornus florida TaxID=4283 RepID=UPI00289A1088|nr:uncharacterized protein LOC132286876 [Cornus florida]